MEKMTVVILALAAAFALAVPAMSQEQQDSAFSGFSLEDIQGLAGNLDQAAKEAAAGGDGGPAMDEVKKAAADFKSREQAEDLSLDDVKAAADSSFQGASDQGGSSWLDWAKDKLTGFGMIDGGDGAGLSAAPGQAPSSAPGADSPAAGPDAGYNY